MCVTFFIYGCPPPQPLLFVAFNRDEYFNRPTQPLEFWQDGSGILAGRDLEGLGTWLGVNARGRVAFLTNLRARDPPPKSVQCNRASRGELPTTFLNGTSTPLEYAQALPLDRYLGFNLVVGDLAAPATAKAGATSEGVGAAGSEPAPTHGPVPAASGSFAYVNNSMSPGYILAGNGTCVKHRRTQAHGDGGGGGPGDGAGGAGPTEDGDPGEMQEEWVKELQAGKPYGLSNGTLMMWPKVEAGVAQLRGMLPAITRESVPWDAIFGDLLGDTHKHVPWMPPPSTQPHQQQQQPALPEQQQQQQQQPEAQESADGVPGPQAPLQAQPGRSDPAAACCALPPDGAQPAATPGTLGATPAHPAAPILGPADFANAMEHITSSRFVEPVMSPYGMYGTRSQTVITVWHGGWGEARERHRTDDGTWREQVVPFRMALPEGIH